MQGVFEYHSVQISRSVKILTAWLLLLLLSSYDYVVED